MKHISAALYIALIVMQYQAIADGLIIWLETESLLRHAGAFVLAWLPGIGTVGGYLGAVTAWGWSELQAGLIYFGGMLTTLFIYQSPGFFHR